MMISFNEFRDKYCRHQTASIPKGEEFVRGCNFKDEKLAVSWRGWQECTWENCPAFRDEQPEPFFQIALNLNDTEVDT